MMNMKQQSGLLNMKLIRNVKNKVDLRVRKMKDLNKLQMITTYYPDEKIWEDDFKNRR